jgi:hypothetical protein
VYPGDAGASHLHAFFGNVTANADSTLESLLDKGTTCEQTLDTASYWAPALLENGQLITPEKSVAYIEPVWELTLNRSSLSLLVC